jgi:hypothetical protein
MNPSNDDPTTNNNSDHIENTNDRSVENSTKSLVGLFTVTSISTIFFGGAAFSCRSFRDKYDSLKYGFRGFTDVECGECMDWSYNPEQYNGSWYKRLDMLFIMGTVAFSLCLVLIALLVLIAQGKKSYQAVFNCGSVAFRILALVTLLGNYFNIPPLVLKFLHLIQVAWVQLICMVIHRTYRVVKQLFDAQPL